MLLVLVVESIGSLVVVAVDQTLHLVLVKAVDPVVLMPVVEML